MALVVIAVFFIGSKWLHIVNYYGPIVKTTYEIRNNLVEAHLWFEELISGDKTVSLESVLDIVDRSIINSDLILAGGAIESGEIQPLTGDEPRLQFKAVLSDLQVFRSVILKRHASRLLSYTGSPIDQEFDELFTDIQMQLKSFNLQMQSEEHNYRQQIVTLSLLVLILLFLGALISAVLISRIEKKQTVLASGLKQAQKIARLGNWSLDLKTNTLEWSDEIFQIFGTDKTEFSPDYEAFLNTIHPEDRAYVNEHYKGAVEGCFSYDIQHRIIRQDNGETRWVHEVGEHQRDSDGNVIKSVGTVQDITEQKEAELQLRDALKDAERMHEAEAANKAKSQFLAAISHELRTPLTGVLGFSDLLLDDNISAESKLKVERIKNSTSSLLRIINDVLDMSKLEAGKMELERLDFDLRGMVDEVASLFSKKRSGEKDLGWNINISDKIPSSINSDPTRVRQILVNLMGNAYKFTPAGEILIRCEQVRENDERSFLKFTISDTGIGMDDATLGSIFTEFTQADASISRKYEGTGLGLTITKHLVELLGGQIGVESVVGKGSTFCFTLPFVEGKPVQQDRHHSGTDYKAVRNLNVLLAEDNRINQIVIQKFLEKFGHQVSIAHNGVEAVEMHKTNEYDLILMDVRMPEMDGPTATRMIRSLGEGKEEIPIIAATADAVVEHVEGYFEAGMDAYVSKPLDWGQLVLTINKVMDEDVHILKMDGD